MSPRLLSGPRAALVGRVLSNLVVLFMAFDGAMKLVRERHVLDAMAELGWPPGQITGLGVVILACTALYAWPRSSVLGAILLTGFLGGATAAKARLGDPAPLFSVVTGALVWIGLVLREPRLLALLPLRSPGPAEEAERGHEAEKEGETLAA